MFGARSKVFLPDSSVCCSQNDVLEIAPRGFTTISGVCRQISRESIFEIEWRQQMTVCDEPHGQQRSEVGCEERPIRALKGPTRVSGVRGRWRLELSGENERNGVVVGVECVVEHGE